MPWRPPLVLLLLLAACQDRATLGPDVAGPTVSAPDTIERRIEIRFEATCEQERLTIWWLLLDGQHLGETGIWGFTGGSGALSFQAVPGVHWFRWRELDYEGWPVQGGQVLTDSLGVATVRATCVPADRLGRHR